MLPAPVDDPAYFTLENITRPGIGGEAQPTRVVGRRRLGHHHDGSAVLVAPEAVEVFVVEAFLVNAVIVVSIVLPFVVDGLGATAVAGRALGLAREVLVRERLVPGLSADITRKLDTQRLQIEYLHLPSFKSLPL